jgi:hypothetical protein
MAIAGQRSEGHALLRSEAATFVRPELFLNRPVTDHFLRTIIHANGVQLYGVRSAFHEERRNAGFNTFHLHIVW